MIMDITNIRLDEVSVIMSKMDKLGLSSRIERRDDKFLLVLNEKESSRKVKAPTILDW
ncbi:MAG: hypothetical protein N3G74_00900 [Candidatus Micrarchaeota archaeon]|nr:hypothetical protein [Candidatus Micrarchaeota archaeon]